MHPEIHHQFDGTVQILTELQMSHLKAHTFYYPTLPRMQRNVSLNICCKLQRLQIFFFFFLVNKGTL